MHMNGAIEHGVAELHWGILLLTHTYTHTDGGIDSIEQRLKADDSDGCKAVAAALNALKYGSRSISGVKCVSAGVSAAHCVPKGPTEHYTVLFM